MLIDWQGVRTWRRGKEIKAKTSATSQDSFLHKLASHVDGEKCFFFFSLRREDLELNLLLWFLLFGKKSSRWQTWRTSLDHSLNGLLSSSTFSFLCLAAGYLLMSGGGDLGATVPAAQMVQTGHGPFHCIAPSDLAVFMVINTLAASLSCVLHTSDLTDRIALPVLSLCVNACGCVCFDCRYVLKDIKMAYGSRLTNIFALKGESYPFFKCPLFNQKLVI